jgi:hypothetical protein
MSPTIRPLLHFYTNKKITLLREEPSINRARQRIRIPSSERYLRKEHRDTSAEDLAPRNDLEDMRDP